MIRQTLEKTEKLAAAMQVLLDLCRCKDKPIKIEFCGSDNKGRALYQVNQGTCFIALQGTEDQILQSIIDEGIKEVGS